MYEAPDAPTYDEEAEWTKNLEEDRALARDRFDTWRERVIEMETRLQITRRWQPSDREYLNVLKFSHMRNYHRALDDLQKLVVQRLFELQKLNLAQTGG